MPPRPSFFVRDRLLTISQRRADRLVLPARRRIKPYRGAGVRPAHAGTASSAAPRRSSPLLSGRHRRGQAWMAQARSRHSSRPRSRHSPRLGSRRRRYCVSMLSRHLSMWHRRRSCNRNCFGRPGWSRRCTSHMHHLPTPRPRSKRSFAARVGRFRPHRPG